MWATVVLCAGLSVLTTGATVALAHYLIRALGRARHD
jgi:hypothetical protein